LKRDDNEFSEERVCSFVESSYSLLESDEERYRDCYIDESTAPKPNRHALIESDGHFLDRVVIVLLRQARSQTRYKQEEGRRRFLCQAYHERGSSRQDRSSERCYDCDSHDD